MEYLYWEHDVESDILPKRVYVEVDSDNYEVRKVEFFNNGEIGYADENREVGRTGLSDRPLPPLEKLEEILENPVVKLTKEQFEEAWNKYAK